MCKHTEVLEAMRTAIVTASKFTPCPELGSAMVAYESLLDDQYTDGCDVCYRIWEAGEWSKHEYERIWMDKVLAKVKGAVRDRQAYEESKRLAPWEKELLGL